MSQSAVRCSETPLTTVKNEKKRRKKKREKMLKPPITHTASSHLLGKPRKHSYDDGDVELNFPTTTFTAYSGPKAYCKRWTR